ncbi:bifunctional diguanylate cyclase/phosphohydrolase [Solirubrobacter soli]|uniref:bifunctional diguanylate cyclase/phosphohydrolase n=1 Tax=Solirubrobacter soli TaxID=363832 RepID=UPI00146E71C5|nr:diguanylate cyclase [Solirubrobacter soli]
MFALLFLAAAGGLLLLPGATSGFDLATAGVLVGLYVILAGVEFPVGAGNVLPTQLVLIPMLVLVPPGAVPFLVAAGLLLARLLDWIRGRGSFERLLFSIPDAWHAVGPACVLLVAGTSRLGLADLPVLAVAFGACCVFDAGCAILRELASRGVAPALQLHVFALVWAVDACLAPIGFLAAEAAQRNIFAILLVLPLAGLLLLMAADRRKRIEQAQHRLELAVRERSRLQAAVRRMGDAFAAKLDIDALVDIMLRGSIEALDADAGRLHFGDREPRRLPADSTIEFAVALRAASDAAAATGLPQQIEHQAGWAVALPFAVDGAHGPDGAIGVARREREFQADEVELLGELVGKAQTAAADILGHHALREAAVRDPLTGLGNRRKMAADVDAWLATAAASPRLLVMLDLNGFKGYNDTFGHVAGDALLARLGLKLREELAPYGEAYRLGGDEFCAVLEIDAEHVEEAIAIAGHALSETGEGFAITASYGVVLLPHEAENLDHAVQLADERMYAHKHNRSSGARDQARDVLMRTMQAKQPSLHEHSSHVAVLAAGVARRLQLTAEELDEVARAAELHDVGKVGVPDAILNKPGRLDPQEWEFMRQHTILGERILNAATALRPVARLVRSSHERWDGTGYPDQLKGNEIPRGSRIVAVCDAYEAMTSDRAYRSSLTPTAAAEELRSGAGTQFDPEVVEAFLKELDRHGGIDTTEREHADAPLQIVVHRVRTLLTQDAPPA